MAPVLQKLKSVDFFRCSLPSVSLVACYAHQDWCFADMLLTAGLITHVLGGAGKYQRAHSDQQQLVHYVIVARSCLM